MQKLKTVYKWIIISIILQVSVFIYVDKFRLSSNIESTFSQSSEATDVDASIKVDSSAKEIKLSFDASYMSYILENKLIITEVKSKSTVKTIEVGANEIGYYKWLPDRNTLIYAVKLAGSGTSGVQITTFDVVHNIEKSYPQISANSKETVKVTDIDLSPLTNVVYIKMNVGNIARIYKFNIMENLKYIMMTDPSTIIEETSLTDNLIYQDNKGKVYVRDDAKGSTHELKTKEKVTLLGLSGKDMIFLGVIDSQGLVSKVLYGKPEDTNVDKSWESSLLDQPSEPGDIFIHSDGTIYQNDKTESKVRYSKTGIKTAYSGSLVYINDNYIVTRNGKSVKIKTLDR